jgi:hypothetical protein
MIKTVEDCLEETGGILDLEQIQVILSVKELRRVKKWKGNKYSLKEWFNQIYKKNENS